MARKSKSIPPSDTTPADWKRIPGRKFINRDTGQVISRRQYDKVFGALARQGYRSYEQKSSEYQPEFRHLRPARGRKSHLAKSFKQTALRGTSPLANGKRWRNETVAFSPDPVENDFIIRSVINNIKSNKKIQLVAFVLLGYDRRDNRLLTPTIMGLSRPSQIDPLELMELIEFQSELNANYAIYYALSIHIVFYQKYIRERTKAQKAVKRIAASHKTSHRTRRKNKTPRNKKTR